MPNIKALNRVLAKLSTNHIPHYAWTEPDYNWGLTSICTAPLDSEQRKVMTNYRVYTPIAQVRASASKAEGVGSYPTRGANSGGETDASSVCL